MGSDLVHAAGDGETLNESPLWPFLARGHAAQKPKRGAAWATAGKTGLAHANAGGGKGVHGGERFGAARGLPLRPPTYDGQVAFVNGAPLHGAAQFVSSGSIFGDEHESACFTIQAVDERHTAAAGQFVGEQLRYPAEQGGLMTADAASGVHDERRRFVHH